MPLRRKRRRKPSSFTSYKRSSVRSSRRRVKAPSRRKSRPRQDDAPTRRRRARGGIHGQWRRLKRMGFLIIAGILIIVSSHFLFISNTLNIETIRVQIDGLLEENHLAEQMLSEFKGTNLLLFNSEEFTLYLQEQYPEYASVTLSKKFPDTLLVTFESYPIVAHLEVEMPDGTIVESKLNSNGQLSDDMSNLEDLPTLRIKQDQTVQEGDDVIDQTHLAFALEATQSFQDKFNMEVVHALTRPIEREVHLWTERNFYVWLDMTQDLDTQLNKLKQALSQLNIYEENIEYIDLRIEGISGEKVIFMPSGE